MTSSVLRLVRDELRVPLQLLLQIARDTKQPADSAPVPLFMDGRSVPVVMRVRPSQSADQAGFVLVMFEELEANAKANEQATPPATNARAELPETRDAELEQALVEARQHLQTVIEEYETSQEEMKAANEEMQSTNEELRSTMEELETSKEELQSINEELQTVNQENRHKVDELSHLSGDLQNLLAATDIATLFLDRELRILRFTPRLADLFNVRITDRGRPISDLTNRLGYEQLDVDARSVLERLIPVERETKDNGDAWYITRILPYRSVDDRIEGVVITFTDITQRKHVENALRETESRLRALNAVGRQSLYRMSADWRSMYLLEGNNVLEDTIQPNEDWPQSYIPEEEQPAVMQSIQRAIETKSNFELVHRVRRADGSTGWVLSRAVPILGPDGELKEWFGSAVDVTLSKEN